MTAELDSRERVRLEWIFENEPELTRELFRQGKLRQHLDQKNQEALRLVQKFKAEKGMSEEEAFEAAANLVLCPPEGRAMSDNPPDLVPYQEQERILDSL
jgi:hypothetical protein